MVPSVLSGQSAHAGVGAKNAMRRLIFLALSLALALAGPTAPAADSAPSTMPGNGMIGINDEAMLSAQFWIGRLANPDAIVLDKSAIALKNTTLVRDDPTLYDLHAIPAKPTRKQVVEWIQGLSVPPTAPLYDMRGKQISDATLKALRADLDLGAIAPQPRTRYALVVHRADLRTFPTALRVFDERGDTDIDRFQESALFPGTPVLSVHTSRDRRWQFVISPRYAAWIESQYIAEGTAAQVFGYVDREPYRIVTGGTATTVFTPEQPSLSQLQLDMGVRVPQLGDWPATRAVNGQHPYTSNVIELPLRSRGGALDFSPALLQKSTDTQPDYLPLTRANVLRQAFKFLGERYGWGDSYNARDCSGFVSDVYLSMGVLMPRNTRAQSVSPGLDHRLFGPTDDRASRLAAVRALEVGDLVYIPGHVMMAIGSIDGEPYVIHDTTGLSYRRPDGTVADVQLNAVSVSPLIPLVFNDTELYIDRMTSIVRIRPDTEQAPPSP